MTPSSTDFQYNQTLPSLLAIQAAQNPAAVAYRSKDSVSGNWVASNWGEYFDRVQRLQVQLTRLGLCPGHTVGILAPTCSDWDLVQMGVLSAGGIVVGIDPNEPDDKINHVAVQCQFAGIVLEGPSDLKRFKESVRQCFEIIIFLKEEGLEPGAFTVSGLLSEEESENNLQTALVTPDDPATILFTSGTTGEPKGIVYTHRQICQAISSVREAFPDIGSSYRLACWLPLSNMFQRVINFLGMSSGAETWYVSNPQVLMRELREIAPHLFIGVPRFYEKLYQGILENLESRSFLQQRMAVWAMRSGHRYQNRIRGGMKPNLVTTASYWVADKLILCRIRRVMGQNLRYMISGSAPMPMWLLESFHALGMLVLEAYGLSENVIPNAINTLGDYRFGTVGRALNGCEIKPAPDGELLVRGPGVISHYVGSDSNLLDGQGFLATGDFGSIDEDGFVTLRGRKSEIIKTSTGRRIAPAPIEAVILRLPMVEYAVLVGQHQQFLTIIIVIKDCATHELRAMAGVCCDAVVAAMQTLPSHSRPAGLLVTKLNFSVEGGELTSNMKLRRNAIHERYAVALRSLYRLVDNCSGSPGRLIEFYEDDDNIVLCKL